MCKRAICPANDLGIDFLSLLGNLNLFNIGNGITCKEINCGGAGSLQFGTIVGNNFTLGGVVRYSCEYGYRLEGPSERICQENGRYILRNTYEAHEVNY